eukprot:685725-Pelagomonas_calceolata.AAC.1
MTPTNKRQNMSAPNLYGSGGFLAIRNKWYKSEVARKNHRSTIRLTMHLALLQAGHPSVPPPNLTLLGLLGGWHV